MYERALWVFKPRRGSKSTNAMGLMVFVQSVSKFYSLLRGDVKNVVVLGCPYHMREGGGLGPDQSFWSKILSPLFMIQKPSKRVKTH